MSVYCINAGVYFSQNLMKQIRTFKNKDKLHQIVFDIFVSLLFTFDILIYNLCEYSRPIHQVRVYM